MYLITVGSYGRLSLRVGAEVTPLRLLVPRSLCYGMTAARDEKGKGWD
ncbi:MAG: hypothetical protein LBH84_09665 [Prevotellaceae bacterium]|nr:hypothetical protein [Prevotellaceae bacterium]